MSGRAPERMRVGAADAAALHRMALDELNAAFAHALDRAAGAGLEDLFTEDARYTSGARVLEGRSAIAGFFGERAAHTVRTTRHMYSGLLAEVDGEQAQVRSSWICWAANAPAPVDEVRPFMVADFQDHCRLEADGRWRIAARTITPVLRDLERAPPSA